MVHDDLSERRRRVEDRVAAACARNGRDPREIRIVAVTKGHPAETVVAALAAGFREIGENRVGQAMGKFLQVAEPLAEHGAVRHMVGHLQRNKARDALRSFDWIQSVDSMRLARTLSRRLEEGAKLPVLVEVNAGGEEQKHGFEPESAVERAQEIAELPGLVLRGLMTMAPQTDDESVLRATFRRARRLYESLAEIGESPPDTLSMGMSGDYPVAVEEGATMIRLGTVLFGPRAGG